MSIGKFNFSALRAADEMAAWIFFVFSRKSLTRPWNCFSLIPRVFFGTPVAVNMVLINMMIAIINMAFEEIKENEAKFQSRFKLVEYIKKVTREVVGFDLAKPIKVKYMAPEEHPSDEEEMDDTQVGGGGGKRGGGEEGWWGNAVSVMENDADRSSVSPPIRWPASSSATRRTPCSASSRPPCWRGAGWKRRRIPWQGRWPSST